ncbi:MAG: hypothetical protein QME96_11905 [Myxococcota bacterium]|nr:hypothetical protein [Myxococcota bacterium]
MSVFLGARSVRGSETPASGHRIAVGLGVPVPLTVVGYRGDSRGFSHDFLGAVTLEYEARLLAAPLLGVGLAISGGYLSGTGGGTAGAIGLLVGGPTLTIGWRPWSINDLGGGVALAAAPVAGLVRLYVDENINMNAAVIGGRAAVRIEQSVADGWVLWLTAAFDWLSEPLNREAFFNETLGSTRLLWFALGGSFEFSALPR